MVEGHANITVKGVTHCIRLSPLELARVWCQKSGFDVDAEPSGEPGCWSLTARSGGASITRTGKLLEAVTKLIEAIQ